MRTYRLTVHAVSGREQSAELVLLLVDKQRDDLSDEGMLVAGAVDARVAAAEGTEEGACVRKGVEHEGVTCVTGVCVRVMT